MTGFEKSEVGYISTVILKNNEGISIISTKLGIRESSIRSIKDIGTMRAGDEFQLTRNLTGEGILRKIRTKVLPGERTIDQTFSLKKTDIYQTVENGPKGFPFISFQRIPLTDEYQLTGKNGEIISDQPIRVASINLDNLKLRINEVSGVFITECNTRKAEHDLSCSIKPIKEFPGSVKLQSESWFDFIATSVDLNGIQKLLKTDNSEIEIARALAKALQM